MTKPKLGFCAHPGRPFNERLYDKFAEFADVSGQPFVFRIHDMDRDCEVLSVQALPWALDHGMTTYCLVIDPSLAKYGDCRIPMPSYVSYGNSQDYRQVILGQDFVEDDSGPVGCMKHMASKSGISRGRHVLFHAYGQSGFSPSAHIPLLAARAEEVNDTLIWSEAGWGFVGSEAKTIFDRPDITSAAAGAYMRQGLEIATKHGIKVAHFLPEYLFSGNCGDYWPNAAGYELFCEYSAVKPMSPPIMKSLAMSIKMRLA